MKAKLYFLLSVLAAVLGPAQMSPTAVPVNPGNQINQLQNAFSNLEKERIPTGLLLDAAVEYANLSKYDGTLPDSSLTSSKLVVDIYNTLIMSRLSANAQLIKTTESFTTEWKTAQQPDVIPLGGLYYKYAQFSELTQQNARNTGNPETVFITNGKIEDKYINGIWINPYEEKEVFAIAPSVNSFNKFNFKIALPDHLFLSNQAAHIQKIEYKLEDNRPYQILPQNQIIDVAYTAEGTYHWTFKLTLHSGEVLYSHTQFNIEGNLDKYAQSGYDARVSSLSEYTKVEIDPYTIPGPFFWSPSIHKARATMYIKLAPGHTQITKPLIVSEGFDMGAILEPSREAGLTNIDGFINSLRYENFDTTLRNYLSNNYDIIYVDWGNGVDYIQNNAVLLGKAIQYINANKVGTEQNVVLGQSMGGLVARYALKDMEQSGISHNTKMFISHDSPHLGANIPLALQYMLVNVSKTYISSPIIAGIGEFIVPVFNQGISVNDVLTLTDTPAARQMLINYVNKNYQIDNSVHNNWQIELKAKGYPQLTRNVAISNGSECGTDQTLEDLLRLYKETGKQHLFSDIIGVLVGVGTWRLDMIVLAALPGSSKYVFDFTARPMTTINDNKQLYNGSIKYKKKILWLIDAQVSLLSGTRNQPANILPIDRYGGGKFILAQEELPGFIKNDLLMTPFGFIPTPSALDYKFGNNTLTEADYQRAYSPVDDASNVPFNNFVAEKMDANNSHISFSPRNGQFILNQLSANSSQQNQTLTTSYLCGSKVKIGGESILCGNAKATYTTGFAPYIQWTVLAGSSLIDVNGPTNQPQISFTPRNNARGAVKLQAYLSGDGATNTVTKDIWLGNPAASVAQINDPSFYYKSQFYLSDSGGIPIGNQGITNIKWTKLSATDQRVRLFASDNNTEGYATGPDNFWSMQLKVEITNACGTTTQVVTILPPAAPPCNEYKLVKQSGSDTYAILTPPTDPCNNNRGNFAGSSSTINSINRQNGIYEITVANSMGAIVIAKTGDSFDMNNFPTGMYVVNIKKDNEVIINQTIIKN